jgi:hypothetical protein
VAADLAKASKTWPATKGQGAERLADLAVKALQEAVAADFRDGARLRGDAAFAMLRGRPDFDALVDDLSTSKER